MILCDVLKSKFVFSNSQGNLGQWLNDLLPVGTHLHTNTIMFMKLKLEEA